MNSSLAPLLVILIATGQLVEAKKFRKCRWFETYIPPAEGEDVGSCIKCEPCPLGQEWDTQVKRARTTDRGYEGDCYPCKPCAEGYFRDTRYERSCRKCRLDCESGFRVTAVKCGGIRPGHCGDCFPGYVPSVIQQLISPCELDQKEILPQKALEEPGLMVIDATTKHSQTKPTGEPDTLRKVLIPLVGGVFSLAVFAAVIMCRKKREVEAEVFGGITSQSHLLQQFSSADGNNLAFSSEGRGEPPMSCQEYMDETQDVDNASSELEMDAPVSTTSVEVHKTGAEGLTGYTGLEGASSDGLAADATSARTGPIGQSRHSLPGSVVKVQHDRLTVNSKELVLVAINVSGDKVPFFYRWLGISEATYEPEWERWSGSDDKHYKDYVLNVLIAWVKQQGPEATRGRLCNALEAFQFNLALHEVDKYIEEREAKQSPVKQDENSTACLINAEQEKADTENENREVKQEVIKPDEAIEDECTREVGVVVRDTENVRAELDEYSSQADSENADNQSLKIEMEDLEALSRELTGKSDQSNKLAFQLENEQTQKNCESLHISELLDDETDESL